MGAYPCSIADIPRFFEEVGFENVSVDFIAVTSAADSAHYDMSLREKIIKSNRQVALDAIVLAENYAPRVWSDAEVQQLRGLVEQRFAKRLNDLRTGRKVWDISPCTHSAGLLDLLKILNMVESIIYREWMALFDSGKTERKLSLRQCVNYC